MSGSLRRSVPQLVRLVVRNPRSRYHRGRIVPIKSWFDDFFGHHRHSPWPMRMMEENMRNMERMIDSMSPWSRGFRDIEYTTRAPKDVKVKYNAKEFEIKLDVESYKPEDLNVKIVADELSITGKIKATDEHGTVTSEFSRQFIIPENVETDSIQSMFTNDGHLVVRGKVKGSEDIPERTINITREAPSGDKSGADSK